MQALCNWSCSGIWLWVVEACLKWQQEGKTGLYNLPKISHRKAQADVWLGLWKATTEDRTGALCKRTNDSHSVSTFRGKGPVELNSFNTPCRQLLYQAVATILYMGYECANECPWDPDWCGARVLPEIPGCFLSCCGSGNRLGADSRLRRDGAGVPWSGHRQRALPPEILAPCRDYAVHAAGERTRRVHRDVIWGC